MDFIIAIFLIVFYNIFYIYDYLGRFYNFPITLHDWQNSRNKEELCIEEPKRVLNVTRNNLC